MNDKMDYQNIVRLYGGKTFKNMEPLRETSPDDKGLFIRDNTDRGKTIVITKNGGRA